jgi:hypothetical protein
MILSGAAAARAAGTAARLLPLSVDGLILAASLMLHEARNGRPAPSLARYMLGLGVAATVAANVAYGSAFGVLGALISAWPAVAFIGSVEMAMGLVRATRSAPEAAHSAPADLAASIAADAESAARAALAASIAADNPLSQRKVMTRFGLTRAAETRVRQAVTAQSNGHAAAH